MQMKGYFTVRAVRLMLGYSQVQFAQRLSMPVNTYIYKETRNKFYFHEIHKICEEFGIAITMIDPTVHEVANDNDE